MYVGFRVQGLGRFKKTDPVSVTRPSFTLSAVVWFPVWGRNYYDFARISSGSGPGQNDS